MGKGKNGAGSKKKRSPRLAYGRWSKNRKAGDAYTIRGFCESRAISEALYFTLKRQNKQPREIELGGRVIISDEAARDWDVERERETAAKRQAEDAA